MSARTQWVFDSDSGGKKIPESVKADIKRRIDRVAREHFEGQYTRLDIRFKGQFCYMDAYQEPPPPTENWPPKDWPETREEYMDRLRNTPTHLCRLQYFGDDQWGFAFYTYSHDKYELSMYEDGSFLGKPEDAFLISARLYLGAS
jgi:hypothetical protein